MTLSLYDACDQIIHSNKRLSKPALKSLTTDPQILDKIELYGSVRFAWHIVNNTWLIPDCPICGKPTKWLDARRRYGLTCSKSCANQDPARTARREQTLLEKYGVTNASQSEEVKAKKRATTLKNYGVEYPAQSQEIRAKQQATTIKNHGVAFAMQSEQLREKQQQTMIEKYGVANAAHSLELNEKKELTTLDRYGVKHHSQNVSIKTKKQETMLSNWGVENPSQHPDIQKKKIDTFINKYGVPSAVYIGMDPNNLAILLNSDLFADTVKGLTIKEAADKLGVCTATIVDKAKDYECRSLLKNGCSPSSYEQKIIDLLNEHNVIFVKHNRIIIAPNELDIYLPDHNLAIEVGSAYWHSERNNKHRLYHYNKWKRCKDKNIILLQFFDEDVIDHWELTKSKILRLVGKSNNKIIGARKVQIAVPTFDEEKVFLNKWHVKGWSPRKTNVLGAYYDSELVAILTIKKENNIATIERYASNVYLSLPGVFSKMLKHWIQSNQFIGRIETWSDNRLGDGKVYLSSGFKELEVSQPGYWYFKNKGLENRVNYQRHKLQKIFNLTEEENRKELTEYDIMLQQGYDRLWDAGHTKWIKEIK